MDIDIGTIVMKVKPRTDYTYGRTGEVLEFRNNNTQVRVHWTHDEYRKPLNKPVKTWVNILNVTKYV